MYHPNGTVAKASPAKQTQVFKTYDGDREFVLEEAIVADFSLVRAWKADRHGNLVFRRAARNFNPLAAMCGRITIAEVEQLVEPGDIDPDDVHTPGVFVQRVVALTPAEAVEKRIEKVCITPAASGGSTRPPAGAHPGQAPVEQRKGGGDALDS